MNITDIKTQNVKKILNCLRFRQNLTKKEISSITDLSFSTVSNICNELKSIGVLSDEKAELSGVGRLPNQLRFRADLFCTVCLDLQMKDVLGFAILTFENHVLFHESYDISHCRSCEEIVDFSKSIFNQKRNEYLEEGLTFVGVGVSVSGDYDRDTGCMVNSAIPSLENVAIGRMIAEGFKLCCYVDNEANLCALSMRCQNPLIQNLLYLHVSQGVGAGVICEGNLLRGHHGYAAEISHIPLGNPDIICPVCGLAGCIEATLCLKGISSALFKKPQLETQHWDDVAAEVLKNPQKYYTQLEDFGGQIGGLLSILYNFLDPEIVYIGGGITRIYPLLEPFIRTCIQERCRFIVQKGYELRCDPDSSMTILLGLNQSIYEKWNGFQMPEHS